jgi:small conductance mechanosensitive channel
MDFEAYIAAFDYSILLSWLLKAIGALILLFATFSAAGWAQRRAHAAFGRSRLDDSLAKFMASLVRYGVLLVGGLAVLGVFGVPVASFAAILAAVGFAVGLALQGTLSNFASGVMLLLFRPFKAGDVVNAAGITAKVVAIDLFTTQFDTFDNRRIIVPNGSIFGSTIENVSFHPIRRADLAIGVSYDADLRQTREVLQRVADSVEGRLPDDEAPAAPQVYLTGLGASSVDYAVRVWTTSADLWTVKERLAVDAKNALDAAGIGIPYPQMDVHLSTDARPPAAASVPPPVG